MITWRTISTALSALLAVTLASGCGEPQVKHFDANSYPDKLSDWGLVIHQDGTLTIHQDTEVYALNTELFSDSAQKLRTVYIPNGYAATYHAEETFQFPVGSIISKTFFYPVNGSGAVLTDASWSGDPKDIDLSSHRLIETRLLVKQAQGWDALPYVWSGDDAYLAITGALKELKAANGESMNYLVPSKNQCASCHATNHTSGLILPIGPKARHLNRLDPVYGDNQIHRWEKSGKLTGVTQAVPANAALLDTSADLEHRARSYLDINCGHCHNPQGAADTSGLLLNYADHEPDNMGICKPPIATGGGSGGRLYSIVPGHANESILSYRIASTKAAAMMPELGRTLVHQEGVDLINEWINSLSGECL